jgi:hypothetical protein
MGRLFLSAFAGMRRIGVIERFAINILRVTRQMRLDRWREFVIDSIRY